MRNNFKSEVVLQERLDLSFADHENDLLILDRALVESFQSVCEAWKHIYIVDAGEKLKDLKLAIEHIEEICAAWGNTAHRASRIVVAGGGSLGDFGGFVASVLKRGVGLVHIPTTWLAAIDSAHGGKTALNVGGIKNQIGTFYPADKVYIFKDVLFALPHERVVDGFGEALKTFLLWEPHFVGELFKAPRQDLRDLMWKHLPAMIQTKYDVVLKDPYEESGVRKKLNLGHTFGHALEAVTHQPHGLCVLQGLIFTLRWSSFKQFLYTELLADVIAFVKRQGVAIWDEQGSHYKFSARELESLLLADKKATGGREIDFVFLKNAGADWREKVSVDAIVNEARRQGWLKD